MTPSLRGSVAVNTGRRQRQQIGGFAARLRQVLQAHGRASGLAKTIGRSEGAMRKWLRGESEPNVTDLRALSQATRTRVEWLVSGEGPRHMEEQSDPGSRVRDAPAPHGPSAPGALDLALLEAVMTVADEQIRAAGRDFPAAKRSALIAAAYDHARARGAVDAEAITRLVRLAA